MAYARSITTRVKDIARRFEASLNCIHHDDARKNQFSDGNFLHRKIKCFLQQRFTESRPSVGFSSFYQYKRCEPLYFFPRVGLASCRSISTATAEESDNSSLTSNAAHALSDTTINASQTSDLNKVALDAVSSQAPAALDAVSTPALSEVAVAAANSIFPVSTLQYIIAFVHSLTGLNWWASIVITIFLIRGITIPLLINHMRTVTRFMLVVPKLEEADNEIQYASSPQEKIDKEKKMTELYKKYRLHRFSQFKGAFISTPIFFIFYFAIKNMIQNVPSFKVGGTLWFTDLTTRDSLYILPVLIGCCLLISTEFNMHEGMQGSPVTQQIKNVSRGISLFATYLCTSLPQGLLIFWLSNHVFSFSFGLIMSRPRVREFLDVPQMPKTTRRPDVTFGTMFKRTIDFSGRRLVSKIRRYGHSLLRRLAIIKPQPPNAVKIKPPHHRQTIHSGQFNDKLSKLEKEIEKFQMSKK